MIIDTCKKAQDNDNNEEYLYIGNEFIRAVVTCISSIYEEKHPNGTPFDSPCHEDSGKFEIASSVDRFTASVKHTLTKDDWKAYRENPRAFLKAYMRPY